MVEEIKRLDPEVQKVVMQYLPNRRSVSHRVQRPWRNSPSPSLARLMRVILRCVGTSSQGVHPCSGRRSIVSVRHGLGGRRLLHREMALVVISVCLRPLHIASPWSDEGACMLFIWTIYLARPPP